MTLIQACRLQASVLFCDIRGFTALFDHQDPMDAVRFANSVLTIFGAVVEDHEGNIDKFMGDGLLAHFGVFERGGNHALNACKCALGIQASLSTINGMRSIEERTKISVGIGINTGELACGTITTPKKSEFTIFGDTVNTASRIESLTKVYHTGILVSHATREAAGEGLSFREMLPIAIRGKDGLHSLYALDA